jgi:hypothetical protein
MNGKEDQSYSILQKKMPIPDMEFNVVLWYGLKGDQIPMPAPRRAAFLKTKDEKEDD